jgi:hypothetical protein
MFRRRRSAAAAVILVLALFAGTMEGFLPHTDDGCATEIHCLTCRALQGGTALFVRSAVLLPVAVPAETAVAAAPRHAPWVVLRPLPSRGPPASC